MTAAVPDPTTGPTADVTADLVVLGAGATGLGAARAARAGGARVVLVEAERPGGDCTHYGCVPSKALLETARRVAAARSGPRYGFSAQVDVDFRAVMDRVAAVVAEVEHDESPETLAAEGIELLAGRGSFTDARTLEVRGADGATRTVRSERFVVATGSRATVPPVDGLDAVAYLDNRTVFDLREQPTHLLVLGGGPIGVELAQGFRRLGSQVTVVQSGGRLLPRDDVEASRALTAVLEREGVRVLTGARAVAAEPGPVLHLSDGTSLRGSHLLVAAGRTPTSSGFGLERTGARTDDRGRVVTDGHLRAAPTVWAAGDCTSALLFTHVGDEQGRLAARNALAGRRFWRRGSWDDRVVPWVTFTEPEVAQVGLTEAQALAEHGERVRVAVVRDADADRARTAGETDGFVKLVAVPGRVGGMVLGRLVGMTAVGPVAGELLGEAALSMRAGTLVGRLAQTVHAYPTWSLSTRIAAARLFADVGGTGDRPARPE
ncbi:MAG TPA: FAD-dependent oxidoreductase [Mycobacteriales bacterium]|nr:FAD-dependent oxidoreductase [Mycobacteriales bacterium]